GLGSDVEPRAARLHAGTPRQRAAAGTGQRDAVYQQRSAPHGGTVEHSARRDRQRGEWRRFGCEFVDLAGGKQDGERARSRAGHVTRAHSPVSTVSVFESERPWLSVTVTVTVIVKLPRM